MKKLADLFLQLFLAMAVFTLGHQLLSKFADISYLAWSHSFLWPLCIVIGSVVYLGISFDRRLPKSVLFPVFMWLGWSLLSYWPITATLDSNAILAIAFIQLLLALLMFKLNHSISNKRLKTRTQTIKAQFSWGNLILFVVISIPLVPIWLLLCSYSLGANLIDNATAGFVQLRPNGLYMTERIYQQEQKKIRLAGMIHLAQEEFYTDLNRSIPKQQTIILAEGVTDSDDLLKSRFSYGKIANLLGLTSQENSHFSGRLITAIETDRPTVTTNEPDILRADIDLNQFNPHTLEILTALAKYILTAESITNGYYQFNRWAQEHTNPNSNDIVMNDLINKRNQNVIAVLHQALDKYDIVVIPWGALHMKGIETALFNAGFILENEQQRLSIDFIQLLKKQLSSTND